MFILVYLFLINDKNKYAIRVQINTKYLMRLLLDSARKWKSYSTGYLQ